MKNRYIISVCCLFAALFSHAEGLDAKLYLQGGKMYAGSVLERSGQTVSFKSFYSPDAVSVPVGSIKQLEFQFDKTGMDQTDAMFNTGRYSELNSILNQHMPAYLPYAGIPANLDSKWGQWLTASYWTGNYENVLETATIISRLKGRSAALVDRAVYYSMLSFLELGDEARVSQFLETEKGNSIFPEDSAPRLYIQARLLQEDQRYVSAIRMAARIVADHGRDADWAPQAELLCAELYFQTGRPESAKAVLDSINECYTNPFIIKKAAALAAQNGMEKK